MRKARHHLAKMKGPGFEDQIRQIMQHLDPETAFPPTLNLEEQGLFALGFYHQKAAPRRGGGQPDEQPATVPEGV